MNQRSFKLVNHRQKNEQRPQLVWLVMSQWLQGQEVKLLTGSEPTATRTRQALGSSPEMSAFADVKDDKTLNEWLHEIALVTSTMSDPDEPQSFQEAWWDPDLISREKWREAICLEFKKMLDMGVWRHGKRNDHPNDCRLVGSKLQNYLNLSLLLAPDESSKGPMDTQSEAIGWDVNC